MQDDGHTNDGVASIGPYTINIYVNVRYFYVTYI